MIPIENTKEKRGVYFRRANRRKCYWNCLGCLKGHTQCQKTKCPDYLSVAQAQRIQDLRSGYKKVRW